ncbi:hypothetical protein H1R20_g8403, partial [Candolleomyces eurysporus]
MGLVVAVSAILHVPQVSCTGQKLLATASARVGMRCIQSSLIRSVLTK